MRLTMVALMLFVAGTVAAESLYECPCFDSCMNEWTSTGMTVDGCELMNSPGTWCSARTIVQDWSNYLVSLDLYTGDGSTVYLRAMNGAAAFFVASPTTHYAVLLHFGDESSGTLFGPGPFRQSWWHVQFGFLDGRLVYRHWPLGQSAPAFIEDHIPSAAQGPFEIQAYSATEAVRIRNLHVEGTGTVATSKWSWGQVKAGYR